MCLRDGEMSDRWGGGPDLAGVWVLILNESWVRGEWMRQRCHLTLRSLCHLKSEGSLALVHRAIEKINEVIGIEVQIYGRFTFRPLHVHQASNTFNLSCY